MNARAYFQVLRPWRTLFCVLLGVFYVALLTGAFSRRPVSGQSLFAFALAGPVFVGSLLAGPLHEVIHRSFFLTLPGGRRILQRWHFSAVAVASVVFFVLSAVFVTDIPWAAIYGLIAALLSISSLDYRNNPRTPLRLNPAVLLIVGLVLMHSALSVIVDVSRQYPWLVLVGGLGVAFLCLRDAFSLQQVRNRWLDPNFFCSQSLLPFVGSDIQLHAKEGARQLAKARNDSRGRDWESGSIKDSMRDWRRVISHARFGRISRLKFSAGLFFSGAIVVPACFVVSYGTDRGSGIKRSFAQFGHLVLDSGRVGEYADWPQLWLLFTLLPLGACGLAWVAGAMAAIPATVFPISRERLAAGLFLEACRLAILVFVSNVAATVLCIYALSRVAGVPFEARMLLVPLAVFAIQPPAILLWISGNFIRETAARIFLGIILGVGSLIGVIMVQLRFVSSVTSFSGLLLCVVATGLAGLVSWRVFQNYYRDCDLNNPGRMLKELGVGLG